MRGGENIATKSYLPLTRQPLPPSHTQPVNSGSHGNKGSSRLDSRNQSDVTYLPSPTMLKHRRTPGSTSDHYVSYKRGMQNDILKDSGHDVIIRPPKTKVAKSKSDGATVDAKNPKYSSLPFYGRPPKRSKAPRKDKTEKLSVFKMPKADGVADRPLLERRSRTFVVESHGLLLNNGSDSLRQKGETVKRGSSNRPKPDPMKNLNNGNASTEHGPTTPARESVSKSEASPKETTFSGKGRWQAGTEREGSSLSQWEEERETVREGARNPLCDRAASGLPPRPKSAGQLRYYDSDDSDESSLDGEIEIVDIDKEFEDDSEPAPYWSQAPPLQIPEVFVQTAVSASSPPWKDGWSGGNSNVQHEPHHQQQPPLPPHSDHAFLQQQPSWLTRKRHDSGESDVSAFSDSLIKPAQSTGRRRIMSEPEILNFDQQRVGARKNGKAKRGGQFLGELSYKDVGDVIAPSTSSAAPLPRERLYSDTMERVLSRYSELGLREARDDVSGKGRASRIPVVSNATTSGARMSVSGHVVPPRKLKPILKQPRSDTNSSTSS